MSVVDTNVVDAVGTSDDGKKLHLYIADHLDWSQEYDHLIMLQEKLNSYIAFIEGQQYKTKFPNKNPTSFCIEIHFLHEPTANCLKFLDVAKQQLEEVNIAIEVVVG